MSELQLPDMTMFKRKRTMLSLRDKARIFADLDANVSRKVIYAKYNIVKSTLTRLLKTRSIIEQSFSSLSGNMKKVRRSNYPELDESLFEWYTNRRNENLPINGKIVSDHANYLIEQLNLGQSLGLLTTSSAWLSRFKQRHAISFKSESATETGNWNSLRDEQDEVDNLNLIDHSGLSLTESYGQNITLPPLPRTLNCFLCFAGIPFEIFTDEMNKTQRAASSEAITTLVDLFEEIEGKSAMQKRSFYKTLLCNECLFQIGFVEQLLKDLQEIKVKLKDFHTIIKGKVLQSFQQTTYMTKEQLQVADVGNTRKFFVEELKILASSEQPSKKQNPSIPKNIVLKSFTESRKESTKDLVSIKVEPRDPNDYDNEDDDPDYFQPECHYGDDDDDDDEEEGQESQSTSIQVETPEIPNITYSFNGINCTTTPQILSSLMSKIGKVQLTRLEEMEQIKEILLQSNNSTIKLPAKFLKRPKTCRKKIIRHNKTRQNPPTSKIEGLSLKERIELLKAKYPPSAQAGEIQYCDFPNCTYRSRSKLYLEGHYKIVHLGIPKPFICDFQDCQSAFRQFHHLEEHRISHTGENPYLCDVCAAPFNNYYTMRKHARERHVDKPCQCSICPKAFKTDFERRAHERKHLGKKPYLCSVDNCGFDFDNVNLLESHHKEAHPEIPFQLLDATPVRVERKRILRHTNIPPLRKRRTVKAKYQKPSEIKEKVKERKESLLDCKCNFCGHILSSVKALRNHVKAHKGELDFACDVCPFRTVTLIRLKEHMVTHNERSWKCNICDKSYKRKLGLIEHQRSHTGERPYICPKCRKSFTTHKNLRSHLGSCDKEKYCNYECPLCSFKFPTRSVFTIHLKKHRECSAEEIERLIVETRRTSRYTTNPMLQVEPATLAIPIAKNPLWNNADTGGSQFHDGESSGMHSFQN